RALAAAARADDGDELALRRGEALDVQDGERLAVLVIGLLQTGHFQGDGAHGDTFSIAAPCESHRGLPLARFWRPRRPCWRNPFPSVDVLRSVPVGRAAPQPVYLVPNPASPFTSVQEFVRLAKNGTVIYGSTGNGNVTHLSMELLRSLTSASLTHVPYKGAA